ncbi:MAG: hypothetical protein MUC66_04970 [Methanolinea sp.]|nr:hypothetical protein [Methanolinea sp.]
MKRVLAPGERVLLLLSSGTGLDRVLDIFTGHGFVSEILLERRVEGETLSVIRCFR